MRLKKEIVWPEVRRIDGQREPGRAIAVIFDILERIRKEVSARDRRIAQAINASDIEVVTTVPADPPDFDGPAIKIYDDGSTTRRLYVWVGGTWRYATLT